MPFHSYEEKYLYKCCWICGDADRPKYVNDSYSLYCSYLNLKRFVNMPEIVPREEDVTALSALLDLLRTLPENESPGKFEIRLCQAKILKGDRNVKRGLLNSLSMVGVIPNQFIPLSHKSWTNFGDITIYEKQLKNTGGRSDMEMPWAGWLGSFKLNEERVTDLFGEYGTG